MGLTMPLTATCECGKRFSVGGESRRETVECPACGKRVALNGAATESEPLSFGVKVVGGDSSSPASSSTKERQMAFSCPGCGKPFRQTVRAAGKPTRCPKCEVEFVIPAAANAPDANAAEADSSTPNSAEHASPPPPEPHVAAAGVEAYSAGKGTSKRRFAKTRRMVLIGYCLLAIGGVSSIVGSFLMAKGSMNAFSGVLGGGLGGGGAGGLDESIRQIAAHWKGLEEFARNPNGPLPKVPLAGLPQGNAGQAGKGFRETLTEQKAKQSSGQTMLIGGVIASGVGMLITFIGGIYLLAGLIGRFIQPQPTVAVAVPPVEAKPADTE